MLCRACSLNLVSLSAAVSDQCQVDIINSLFDQNLYPAMAPKALGGAGNKTAQDYVAGLRLRGSTEEEIRQQLKRDGYKAGRISQLIKATRPADGQAGPAAAAAPAPKHMARPAAAEPVTAAAAMKKPAAARAAAAPEARM